MAFLYDLPDQEDVDDWKKIQILVDPLGSEFLHFTSSGFASNF